MNRLATKYLGLDLATPLIASAGPLTGRLDTLRRLEDAGAAAVVLPSLFEEEINHATAELQWMLEAGADSFPEALSFFPEMDHHKTGPERYLELIESAKGALSVPVIASMNGATPGGWVSYASLLTEAGADAIEMNIYAVAASPSRTSTEVEEDYARIVTAVRSKVAVPIAVKISPYFTTLAHMAVSLADAGADGLVLFNRFFQPDIDIETREVNVELGLSTSVELRLPLRWIAILHGRVEASLALSTGVHTSKDAAKALLAGADVVMAASSLIRNGPEHLKVLEDGLVAWMDEQEYESVAQLRGSTSQRAIDDPAAYERANYVATLRHFSSPFARPFGI